MKKISKMLFASLFLAVMGIGAADCAAQENTLKVKVSNIQSHEGNIMIAVGDYTKQPIKMASGMVKADADNVEYTLKGLPVGKSSLYIFHDANSNYNLDMHENMIPAEGCYQGEITIAEGENTVEIKLVYYPAKTGGK